MKKLISITVFTLTLNPIFAQLGWLRLPDFPGPGIVGTTSFSINGKGYIGLGYDSLIQPTTTLFEYDPVPNTWTQKASLPSTPRFDCVEFVINNKGYIATGYAGGLTNEVWEYNPSTNAWVQKADFPGNARQGAAGFTIGNKGYLGTGYASGNSFSDFYEFDPANNSWVQKASIPGQPRNTAAGFAIGPNGYIGMGTSTGSSSNFNDLYAYDPVLDSWTQKADFPITHIDCPSFYSTSTEGYILCGYYYQNIGITHNPLNTLYKYDPFVNEWSLSGTFIGLPRGYAAGFSIGNDIYFGCGSQTNDNNPAMKLKDFWKLSNGLSLVVSGIVTETDFEIFPNPSSDIIQMKVQEKLHNETVRIYSASGQLISRLSLNGKSEIDISGLPTGSYFIELITRENKILDSRFVKE